MSEIPVIENSQFKTPSEPETSPRFVDLLQGRRGLVLGVANHRSIAWSVAEQLQAWGAEVVVSVLDERSEKRAKDLFSETDSSAVVRCDVKNDEQIEVLVQTLKDRWNQIDFIIHSIAFARLEDLQAPLSACGLSGYLEAFEVSAHSLLKITHACLDLLSSRASIITLSYLGAEVAIPSYGLMGPVKSALESQVRYLAAELGSRGIRVNAVSAGPLKTLAASAIPGFRQQLKEGGAQTPLGRPITHQEVAQTIVFLCSSMSSGITGEVIHVDAGQHAVRAW